MDSVTVGLFSIYPILRFSFCSPWFRSQEKSRRVSLYKELAEDLLEWLEQAIAALTEDTDLPRDLIQLRNLQKNLLVFKQDIMHAKLVNKYKIESLHDEITVSSIYPHFKQDARKVADYFPLCKLVQTNFFEKSYNS